MAVTLDKKKKIVKDLEDAMINAKSVVFVNFHKLPVNETVILRRNLTNANVGYKVARKTLIKKAIDSAKVEGEYPVLNGEVAIAFGEDLIAPAREVFEFQKTHKENISILGGIFEGKFMNQAEMLSIATIPGIQTLRAQFVNLINSPIQRFAVVLSEIAKSKK